MFDNLSKTLQKQCVNQYKDKERAKHQDLYWFTLLKGYQAKKVTQRSPRSTQSKPITLAPCKNPLHPVENNP